MKLMNQSITIFRISVITMILFCTVKTSGQCLPLTTIPRLHKETLQLENMYKNVININNQQESTFQALYNYPIDLLQSTNFENIDTIYTIQSMEWASNKNSIDYLLTMTADNPVSLLIIFRTKHYEWTNLEISILVNDKQYRKQLYFGTLSFDVGSLADSNSSNYLSLSKRVSIQNQRKFTKVSTFITGLTAERKNNNDYRYEISIQQNIQEQEVVFNAIIGLNNVIKMLEVSYIGWNREGQQTKNLLILSNSVTLGTISSTQQSNSPIYWNLSQFLPIEKYYLFGISGIKIKSGFKPFKIQFKVESPSVLSISTKQSIQFLEVDYFGISYTPNLLCQNCSNKFAYSKNSSSCLSTCPVQAYLYIFSQNTGKSCIQCSKKLNRVISIDKKCMCNSQFVESSTKQCIAKLNTNLLVGATFSTATSDCIDPNSQLNAAGGCICKSGYVKNSTGQCINNCTYGFWNQIIRQCVLCPSSTYPWEQFQECRLCADKCEICLNAQQCRICSKGFYTPDGQCIQICGDGIKFNLQCDDGNKVKGDGCSEICKIESGYNCNGGSSTQRDICSKQSFDLQLNRTEISSLGLIAEYEIKNTPSLPLYSKSQLKNIIVVTITDQIVEYNNNNGQPKFIKNNNIQYPQQIYYSQDATIKSKFLVVLIYPEQPLYDFNVIVKFDFGTGGQQSKFIAKFLSQYKQRFQSNRRDNNVL